MNDVYIVPQALAYIYSGKLVNDCNNTVFKGVYSDKECCIKVVSKHSKITSIIPNTIYLEEAVLKYLKSKRVEHVPKLMHSFEDRVYKCYITNWIDGDELFQLITSNKLLIAQKYDILIKLCNVVQRLHDIGVVHRDIKPSNIIVDHQLDVHLIDFGFAVLREYRWKRNLCQTSVGTGPLYTRTYNSHWHSKHIRSSRNLSLMFDFSVKCDVFALVETIYATLAGYNSKNHYKIVHDNHFLDELHQINSAFRYEDMVDLKCVRDRLVYYTEVHHCKLSRKAHITSFVMIQDIVSKSITKLCGKYA